MKLNFSVLPAAKIRFIEPTYARLVNELPEGKEWLYEVKFDGYRCLASRDSTGVTLWSRRGNLFTKQFPHIARACERLPPGTVVDGEIVALGERGRVSFNLLQHHRSKARALLFYMFDVLVYCGRNFMPEPLESRRQILSKVINDIKAAPIGLSESLSANTKELIRGVWFRGYCRKAQGFTLRVRQTNRCMGQVQGQPGTRVCHRRLYARESNRRHHCGLLCQR